MVGVAERTRAFFRDHEPLGGRRLDRYLTAHLPELIREHELATEESLRPLDEQLGRDHGAVLDLEQWKVTSARRLEQIKRRLGRLEVRRGRGAG